MIGDAWAAATFAGINVCGPVPGGRYGNGMGRPVAPAAEPTPSAAAAAGADVWQESAERAYSAGDTDAGDRYQATAAIYRRGAEDLRALEPGALSPEDLERLRGPDRGE